MKIVKFEDLEIWQNSLSLTKTMYDLTSKPNFCKDFGLKDQVRRSTVSISSNIAEGFEKSNNNEFIRFLKISKGSAGELRNQMYIALTVGYLDQNNFEKINTDLITLSNKIGGLINYLENARKNKQFIKKSR